MVKEALKTISVVVGVFGFVVLFDLLIKIQF